ncbi:zinc ABC transporter ATP-binding protein [Halorhodospira abdelmalekii]|uniref:metal ABC transporter ATP-binding protein n=1 Tax=Halorhodospira abdelmalekii TaxID=421629 RepID=UPI001908B0F8|nr:metal ABC transporter ATP-binding protein [Halorhodospira abdelmalekii]MBK1735640.1 zinc ABC transporter ATP-binding protein [Halorhodospira abdelmalekii]
MVTAAAALRSEPVLIRATGVGVEYGGRALLNGVDLDVVAGRITTFVGNNGAGKSTLLRLLIGLSEPSAGRIERCVSGGRLRIGYVPQHFAVDTNLPISVRRFIALAGKVRQQWAEAIAATGVESLLSQPLQSLSGGELRRVLLARALLRRPQLLALDEPAAGLDVRSQGALYRLIGELRDRYGCAVVVVSHDLNLVMAASDEVLCLEQGRVACRGAPHSVVEHPEYQKLFGAHLGPETAVFSHAHTDPHTQSSDLEDHKHHKHHEDHEDHEHCERDVDLR